MRKCIILLAAFLFIYHFSFSQNTVTGKVTDSKDGTPLQGVTVIAKGSNKVEQTKADGSFTIELLTKERILTFSYVGFSTEEVNVGNRKNISVSLSTSDRKLQ